MRVFTYVIDHDLGFAPNPFHGTCTLAACKPRIRRYAERGDHVVGTGSAPNGITGHLSYWMRVGEIITFDEYWNRPEFAVRRPSMFGSRMQRYGDNIYRHDEDGDWIQEDSFHSEMDGSTSEANLIRDTGATQNVLIADAFAYWGGSGPKIPDEFSEFVHSTQGHKCRYPSHRVDVFAAWLHSLSETGLVGRPANWP